MAVFLISSALHDLMFLKGPVFEEGPDLTLAVRAFQRRIGAGETVCAVV